MGRVRKFSGWVAPFIISLILLIISSGMFCAVDIYEPAEVDDITNALSPDYKDTLVDASTIHFPLYKLDSKVEFRWGEFKNATSYRYKISDLSTDKVVKYVSTKKTLGFLPSTLNERQATYSIRITGHDETGKVIGTWKHYFHSGKFIKQPEGKIYRNKVAFTDGSNLLGYVNESEFYTPTSVTSVQFDVN